jgi:D-alanyl-D-alanine carboxypeptidase (penicillin-binding protein 5/6)
LREPQARRLRERRPLAALALAAALLLAAPAHASPPKPPALDARAWVLIDASDGEVLAAHRAQSSYPIASTTKLMTAYVARRDLKLDEQVTAPLYVPSSPAESLLGLQEGERITVRDLLYGLLLASGNDAAVTLADASAGSTAAFVGQMNAAARRLGLDQTSYANPIGLDDPDNYSSATDLAELADRLLRDRFLRKVVDTPEIVLSSGAESRDVVNRNTLVRTVPYVTGVKTGYTLGAGNVLVASASREHVKLISAVLGAPSESARDSDSLALLDYGYSLYHDEKAVSEGQTLARVPVRYQDESLSLTAGRTVRLTVRRGQHIKLTTNPPGEVEGPIEKGERLGSVKVLLDGEKVASSPLVASTKVPAADLGDKLDSAIPGPRALAWIILTALVALVFVVGYRLFTRRSASR